jgi:hypothetical protein
VFKLKGTPSLKAMTTINGLRMKFQGENNTELKKKLKVS